MQDNNGQESATTRPPPVDTGRKLTPLSKHPRDLDFTKTIGGTTYVVRSYFNPDAEECLLTKVARLFCGGKDLSEDENLSR